MLLPIILGNLFFKIIIMLANASRRYEVYNLLYFVLSLLYITRILFSYNILFMIDKKHRNTIMRAHYIFISVQWS